MKSRGLSRNVTSLHCFLLMLMLGDYGACHFCPESSCGGHGPVVRFPFWIRGRQPEHSGYPGFALSCSEANHTVLHLPNSATLFIRAIDYKHQVIYTGDPQGCLPRQRLDFDPSFSPFQPEGEPQTFSLFNCPSQKRSQKMWRKRIDCLSTPIQKVYIVDADVPLEYVELLSCTKMYELRTVPYEIVNGNIFTLAWNNTNCRDCEAKDHRCRYRNESVDLETECYQPSVLCERTRRTDKSKKLLIIGITIGFPLLVLVLIRLYSIYNLDKIEKEYREKIERFLEDY